MKTTLTRSAKVFLSSQAIWCGMLCAAVLSFGPSAIAQSTYWWLGQDAYGGFGSFWNYNNNWSTGEQGSSTGNGLPGSSAYLNFGKAYNNSTATAVMTPNNSTFSSGYQIYFKNTAQGAYNLTGNQLSFFDFSGSDPNIQNEGTTFTHTITMPIANGNLNGSFHILNINLNASPTSPARGSLTFNGTVASADASAALRVINVYNDASSLITFNGIISDFDSTHKLGISQLGTGSTVFGAANTFSADTVVNAGKLQFASGGSANSSAIRIGDTSGSANVEVDLTPTAGGLTLSSVFNSRSGSSGTATIASQNTSSANTLSGHVALDKNLIISQAAGGTLNITQAHTGADTGNVLGNDIKSYNETFSPASGGTINVSGTIYNSTGSGSLVVNGGGTVTLGAANTFGGGVNLSATCLLNIGNATALGSGALTLGGTGSFDNTSGGSLTIGNALTCSSGSPTFIGSSPLIINGATTISGNNRTITVNASTLALSGGLGDSSQGRTLTKAGAGTLTLNGASTHSGGTTVSAGTLIAKNAAALGATSGMVSLANGTTLTLAMSSSVNAYPLALTQTSTGNNVTNLQDPGVSTAGFTHAFAGLTMVSGTNWYLANNFNSTPTVSFTSATLGKSTAGTTAWIEPIGVNVTIGGTVQPLASASSALAYGLNLEGTSTGNQISGNMLDAGSGTTLQTIAVTKLGASSWTLSGNNTYSGLTTVSAGTLTLSGNNTTTGGLRLDVGQLNINNNGALGSSGTFNINSSGAIIDNTSAGAVTVANNNPITFGGDFSYGGTKDLNLGTGTATFSANRAITLAGNSGSTLTFGGAIANSASIGNKIISIGGTGTSKLVINGNISDGTGTATTGFTMTNNNGSLTLAGSASTYTGINTVQAGTLIVGANAPSGSSGALGNSIAQIALGNGSTLSTDTPQLLTGGAFTVGRPILVGSSSGTVGANYTIGGNADANSTFSGLISVNKNMLVSQVATTGNNALNITGGIANNTTSSARSVTFNGPGAITVSGTAISDGSSSGALSLVAAGGTLTLSGANTFSGGVSLNAGTLNVNNANALGTVAGTLTLTGVAGGGNILNNTSGSAIINAVNTSVSWAGATPAFWTFGTATSTANNNLDLGSGTVTASTSRSMSFAGTGTTLTMGTLDNTSGTSGRTFTFDQTGSGNTMILRGWKISSGATAPVVNTLAGAANLTISGAIVNGSAFANGVNINGTGITSFNGNNTYDGPTMVASGSTLKLGHANALGTTADGTTVSSGGTLDLNGQAIGAETLVLNGSGVSGAALTNSAAIASSVAGAVTLSGDSTIGVIASGLITLSGGVGESGGAKQISKVGEGTLILSGSSSYSGPTKISAGTLQVNSPSALASGSTLTSGGSTSDSTLLNLAAANSGYAMAALSIGGIMKITNGAVSGSSTLTFAGSAAQGFTGAAATKKLSVGDRLNVVINGSDFQLLGAGVTADRAHTIQVDGAGTLTFNDAIIASGSSFNAGFTKQGTGLLTLSGNNTYNGPTAVSAGTMIVNNTAGSGTGSGAVTVSSGGTLSGNGTISGATTVGSGSSGILSPGSSAAAGTIGTLTLGSTLTLGTYATVSMDINKAVGPVYTADKAAVTGAVTYAGVLSVAATGSTLAAGDTFTLFTGSGFGGSFSSVSLPTLASGISWDTNDLAATGVLDIYNFTTTPLTLSTPVSTAATITALKLANHVTSSRGTPVLVSASAPGHGTASVSGGALTYTPTTGYSGSDIFTGTFSDGHGTQTMSVNVTVGNGTGESPNILVSGTDANGNFYALFAGMTNTPYTVETNSIISGLTWVKYINYTTGNDGLINVTNVVPIAGQLYFRTVYPSY